MGGKCSPSGGINTIIGSSLPMRDDDKPNSRSDLYDENGKLIKSFWYDDEGMVMWERDYTEHGNPKKHPVVPHDHQWTKNQITGKSEHDPKWQGPNELYC